MIDNKKTIWKFCYSIINADNNYSKLTLTNRTCTHLAFFTSKTHFTTIPGIHCLWIIAKLSEIGLSLMVSGPSRKLQCWRRESIVSHWDLGTPGSTNTRVDANTLLFSAMQGFVKFAEYVVKLCTFPIFVYHMSLFSRLLSDDDERAISAYPRLSRIRSLAARYCMTCGVQASAWITLDNDRLPHNPCFFCDKCFKSYNYIDGKKIGNFKAFPYPEDDRITFDK